MTQDTNSSHLFVERNSVGMFLEALNSLSVDEDKKME